MAVVSDNFTRANGGLGANWTAWTWSNGAQIVSNQAEGSTLSSTTGNYWSANTFGNDQWAEAKIAATPTGSDWVGVTIRQSAVDGSDGYEFIYYNNSGTPDFRLYKTPGTPVFLTGATGTAVAGDTIRVAAVGTTISCYHNGTLLFTFTDSTYTAGKPGLAFFNGTATPSGAVSFWTGSDQFAFPPPKPQAIRATHYPIRRRTPTTTLPPVPNITLVGQNGVPGGNHANPLALAYTSTAGNWLILTGHLYNNGNNVSPTPIGISDTAGNTWHISATDAASPPTSTGTNPGNTTQIQTNFIAWTNQNVGPVTSISITRSDGTNLWYRVTLSEWSGIAQFDNSNAGNFAPATAINLPSVNVNSRGELVVASADNILAAPNVPPGWTAFGASAGGDLAYQIDPSIGAYSPPFTSPSAGEWSTAIAVFSPVSLGTGGSVNVNGLTASVSVAAPMGTVSISTPGVAANVAVAAPVGTVSVSTPGSVSGASVSAPAGTEAVSTTAAPAGVAVAATPGTESVSVQGAVAGGTVAAIPGLASVSAAGSTGQVLVAAPRGSARGSGQGSLFLAHII